MNDNDIIKALEYCINCVEQNGHALLDLISRQKAEIEKLKRDVDEAWCEYYGLQIDKDEMFNESVVLIKNAEIQAIKEFAERLNKQAFYVQQIEWEGRVVAYEDIVSLVKKNDGGTTWNVRIKRKPLAWDLTTAMVEISRRRKNER